jgi:hypothetical protein
MPILTPGEKKYLGVFLHEATTPPFFKGPATQALYAIGIEYRDISYIAWAYDHEVPRTGFGWGHVAAVAPPLPWPTAIRLCAGTWKSSASGNSNENPWGCLTRP